MRLSLYELRTGVETIGGNRVVYDVARDEAHFGAARVEGPALVGQIDETDEEAEGALLSCEIHVDPLAEWVTRCDRIDFPLGGVAKTHTHPGPGIRYLLRGDIEIRTGSRSSFHGPGGAWFEAVPDPVHVTASQHLEASFVRVMLLPAEWAGKRTIRYVGPEDEHRSNRQRARVFFDHPVSLR